MDQAVERYGAPVKVSPFIRFCRWSALLTGVLYGAWRFGVLKRRETERRAYVAKMKPIWDEEKKKEKMKMNRAEMLELGKQMGIPTPKNFDQQYPPV